MYKLYINCFVLISKCKKLFNHPFQILRMTIFNTIVGGNVVSLNLVSLQKNLTSKQTILHQHYHLYVYQTHTQAHDNDFCSSVGSQNKYSTRSPTPCRRLWCWCPRIFGHRHLPSKRAWKVFTLYWRCWCRFCEEKQFVVHFGTWTMNQNALWQFKSPQTKTRRTKAAC